MERSQENNLQRTSRAAGRPDASSENAIQAKSIAPPPLRIESNQSLQKKEESGETEQTTKQDSFLQRAVGGFVPPPPNHPSRAIGAFYQAKYTLGAPDDHYEREADSVADKVVSQINTPTIQQKEDDNEAIQTKLETPTITTVQRSGSGGEEMVSDEVSSNIESSRGGGSSMPADVQTKMGDAMGADFSGVRIHNNSNADTLNRSVNARAFTTGQDIFFKQNEYNPSSSDGQHLLAHELTHVVQQNTGVMNRKVIQRSPPRNRTVTQINANLPTIQADAALLDANYRLASAYVDLSVGITDLLRTKLQIFSLNYGMAYSNYSRVITAGGKEAQNQTLWRGIFLGIATGVLAGVAAAYILPSTAAGWCALTLAEVGTAAASSAGQAAVSGAVALALSDAMTARGSDLQPGGLSPDVLRSNIWQHLSTMYRSGFEMNRVLSNLHQNNVIAERLMAEMRVHIAGGASTYTAEDILGKSERMIARVTGMRPVFEGLGQKATQLRAFSDVASAFNPSERTVEQLEKDIWIMWMAGLSDDDSDILDLDAIEDHLLSIGILGRRGLLGVDFGDYTSKEDELAALRAARPLAGAITQRFNTTASQWTLPAGAAAPTP